MIGATSLISKDPPRVPEIDEQRGRDVIGRIDAILRWTEGVDRERDTRFAELGAYLCEVRARQFWRVEGLRSFDHFLETRFPDSRRKAYYLMAIYEQLPPKIRPRLAEIGWSKAIELVRVARNDGEGFDSEAWVRKAESLSKEQLKEEVERYVTGEEGSEIIYFKIYKSQVPVIEEAIETAGMLLGSDYSRGYCLEMICADFLAGVATLPERRSQLPSAIVRLCQMLHPDEQQAIHDALEEAA